jgi:hypothetical protein
MRGNGKNETRLARLEKHHGRRRLVGIGTATMRIRAKGTGNGRARGNALFDKAQWYRVHDGHQIVGLPSTTVH